MSQFSWKRVVKILSVIFGAAAAVGAVYWLINFRPAKIVWASIRQGNIENFLPCVDLPFMVQVEKSIKAHGEAIEKVQKISGVTKVSAYEMRCSLFEGGTIFTKGYLLVEYDRRSAKSLVAKTIGRDFFGIAYRGVKK